MDVYSLSDPRTKQVRYVGMAKNAYRRYAQHLLEPHSNEEKDVWMEELKEAGTAPVLAILESNIDESAVREREKHWIAYHLSQGFPLTNIYHAKREHIASANDRFDDYIPALDAAQLLSLKFGRSIDSKYVMRLARSRKKPIRMYPVGNRYLYNREDLERVTIKQKHPAE